LFRTGQTTLSRSFRFEPDGRVGNYKHPNEASWRIEDGNVMILRDDGTPSCVAKPMWSEDGTLALAGRFLLADREIIHRFDELSDGAELPAIFTFDLFDTLVARRCKNPLTIFHIIEAKSGIAGFAHQRREVELGLFRAGDYTFDDIYMALGAATGWDNGRLETLKALELAEEWDNLFPIQEMVTRVRPEDMIVSDMYLPLSFLRRIVDEKCGLHARVIHLSSHGKHSGKVWPIIQSTHQIVQHYGDNKHADVDRPREIGIAAEHVTLSEWNIGELVLIDAGLPQFAEAIREARLRTFDPDPNIRRAQLAQLTINLPLLILASLDVLRRAREEGADTLLMCSRDCNLWVELMRWMSPLSSRAATVHYFTSSRVLLLSDSLDYGAYFWSLSGRRNMIVDVSGTGRSPAHFIGRMGDQSRTSLYLLVATHGVAPFINELAPARDDVRTDILTVQDFPSRITIEALNMSLEGRAWSITAQDGGFSVEREPNEFGDRAETLISAMRDAFAVGLDTLRRSAIRVLPEHIAPDKIKTAVETLIALSRGMDDVTTPIKDDVLREEPKVAAAAQAERKRSVERN